MAKLKAAVITDIHYGFDTKDKLGSKAPSLMKQFIKAVNTYQPDFIADLGDRISSRSLEQDTKYMYELKNHFNNTASPLYSVIGNHDLRYIGRHGNEAIMGVPSTSYTKDVNDYHFIFWNPKFRVTKEGGIELEDEDIEWLEKDLKKNSHMPSVLFSHVPLDNLGKEGHEDISRYFYWSQGDKVRKVMEEAGNVILCMHGHRHRNRHREINGIHYITQQSFTSQWKKHYRVPSRTFSYLELDDDSISVKLQGKVKTSYDLSPCFTMRKF